MRRHISTCHEKELTIKNNVQLSSLKESTSDRERKAHEMLTKDFPTHSQIYSYQDLKALCAALQVKHTSGLGGSMSKVRYIQCLCSHYCFPCEGTNFESDLFQSDDINNSINDAITHEINKTGEGSDTTALTGNQSNVRAPATKRKRTLYFLTADNYSCVGRLSDHPESTQQRLPKDVSDCDSGYQCLINIMEQRGMDIENVTPLSLRTQLSKYYEEQCELNDFMESASAETLYNTFRIYTKEVVAQKIMAEDQVMDHMVTCPIFTKLFHISIGVWYYDQSRGTHTDMFEYLPNHNNTVMYHHKKGYIHVHSPNTFQYIVHSKSKHSTKYSWYKKTSLQQEENLIETEQEHLIAIL